MRRAVLLALIACKSPDPEPCTCTPGNTSHVKMDGTAIVAALRKHKLDVAAHKNPRDIKVADDQLRFAVLDLCQPCGDWVRDRLTMEEMFPLERLDEATSAVCMGLVLRDGSTVYGDARTCR